MSPQSLFTRAAAQALREGSKERALAVLALRRLWHAVFDPCPELSRLYGDKNRDFLDPFLDHAAARNLSMRWSLHAHLLMWLKNQHSGAITASLEQEFLAAACARWANEDQTEARGMLLFSAGMKASGLAAWKLRGPEVDVRVVLVSLPAPDLPAGEVYWAPLSEDAYPSAGVAWRPVPD